MKNFPTSDEYLLDWDVDAGTSNCENDLGYLADSTSLSSMEPINSNALEIPPHPIEVSSDLPLIGVTKETAAPPLHYAFLVRTVSDTSSADQSYYSASETSLGSHDQALHKEKRPRPVKRTRRWKKPKNAPKRYLSAYNFFFQEERRRVYAESDERIGFSGLAKIIGHMWSLLTDEQREPYEIKAGKDISRYRDEMKMYEDSRRRKYCRSSSSVTAASTPCDDTRCPSPDRVSSALHPVLESAMHQHQYAHHPQPLTVYAPQVIMPDQRHNGQYGRQQQQYPQVRYACYRMKRQEAQDYMHRCAGGQHYARPLSQQKNVVNVTK
jgi:hypothetical protein